MKLSNFTPIFNTNEGALSNIKLAEITETRFFFFERVRKVYKRGVYWYYLDTGGDVNGAIERLENAYAARAAIAKAQQ